MKIRYLLAAIVFGGLIANTEPHIGPHAPVDRVLALADRDGDGRISREEEKAFAEREFRVLDTNGDGVLSRRELKRAKATLTMRG